MTARAEISVRLATPADAERLAALLVAQLREHEIPTAAEAVAASVAATLADPERGFILAATADGVIEGVAYVSFARPLEHAGEVAWLEELYVAPARRGLGVGQMLVAAVTARAEARGCASIELEVEADHGRAAHLYEREGFRPMRRTHWVRPLRRWDWSVTSRSS
jgi:ribosomal protein S18 acetylase RimI-like enzyme